MRAEVKVYGEDYPSRQLLELIGDKWTPIVLYVLGSGTRRYGEMQCHLPDVSKKMLTQTLRALEEAGLLRRTVYAEVPPRVEYDLTELGRAFLEPVTACAGGRPTTPTNSLSSGRTGRRHDGGSEAGRPPAGRPGAVGEKVGRLCKEG